MARPRAWFFVALSLGLAITLVLTIAWNVDPHLFEKRSPAVTLTGITRSITFGGSALHNVTGFLTSGCSICPLTIRAGSSASILVGAWYDNMTSGPGPTAWMNWTVVSPYPFQALAYTPPTPPMVYSWSDHYQVGPYGGGGFGFYLTIVVPYSYSNLPRSGNITLTMTATQIGAPNPPG